MGRNDSPSDRGRLSRRPDLCLDRNRAVGEKNPDRRGRSGVGCGSVHDRCGYRSENRSLPGRYEFPHQDPDPHDRRKLCRRRRHRGGHPEVPSAGTLRDPVGHHGIDHPGNGLLSQHPGSIQSPLGNPVCDFGRRDRLHLLASDRFPLFDCPDRLSEETGADRPAVRHS